MTSQHLTAPDGGWGWVIAGCSLVNHVCLWGTIMSLSVFYLSWLDEFGTDKSQTSWVISSCVSVMFISGPICSSVTSRLGYRLGTVLGGILACLGLVISSFATCVPHLIVSIGLLTGFGFGLVYLSSLSIVVIYFDKWRALALCIATAGTGVGSFIAPPLMNALTDAYTWRGALLVASGVSLHTCVTGVLMRPLQSNVIRNGEERDAESLREKLKEETCADDRKPNGVHQLNPVRSGTSVLDKRNHMTSQSDEVNRENKQENDRNEKNYSPMDHILTDTFPETKDFTTPHVERVSEKCDNSRSHTYDSYDGISHPSDYKRNIYVAGDCDEVLLDESSSDFLILEPRHNDDIPIVDESDIKTHSSSSSSLSLNDKRRKSSQNHYEKANCEISNPDTEKSIDKSFDVPSKTRSSNCDNLTVDDKQQESENCLVVASKSGPPTWRRNLALLVQSHKEVTRMKAFPFLAASQVLLCLSFITSAIFMVDRAKHNAIPKDTAVWLVSIYGLGGLMGRLFFGMLADKYMRNHLRNYIVILTAAGMATMSSAFYGGHFILSGVYAGFFGYAIGVVTSLSIIVIVDLMGSDKVSTTLGLLLCCAGLGHFLGPPISGWIFDSTNSYVLSYVCQGVFLSLSGLVLLPVYCTRNRKSSSHSNDAHRSFNMMTDVDKADGQGYLDDCNDDK